MQASSPSKYAGKLTLQNMQASSPFKICRQALPAKYAGKLSQQNMQASSPFKICRQAHPAAPLCASQLPTFALPCLPFSPPFSCPSFPFSCTPLLALLLSSPAFYCLPLPFSCPSPPFSCPDVSTQARLFSNVTTCNIFTSLLS